MIIRKDVESRWCRPVAVLALLLVGLASTAGCTTMRMVEVPTAPAVYERVAKGDHVRIHTRDGREFEFKVTAVDRDGITGVRRKTRYRVPYSAIAWLEVREFDWAETAGNALATAHGVIAAAYVVLIVALLSLPAAA